MKAILKKFWWVGVILLVILVLKLNCKNAILHPSNWWHNIFHIDTVIPDPDPHADKPEHPVVHFDKPVRPFPVGGVEVNHGETVVLIPVGTDSMTFQQIKIPMHGSGKVTLYIDPHTGKLTIEQDRFGFDLNFTAGPSIHGFAGGLETLFLNDVLGTTIHAVTPALEVSVWNEDRGDVYVGAGLAGEIWSEHTPIRLEGAYEWFVEDLQQSRITVGVTVPLAF